MCDLHNDLTSVFLAAAPEPAPAPAPEPAPAAAPAAAAPAAAAPSVEVAAKEVKKMSVEDDVLTETPAQREARHAEVKKTLADIDAEDPR